MTAVVEVICMPKSASLLLQTKIIKCTHLEFNTLQLLPRKLETTE